MWRPSVCCWLSQHTQVLTCILFVLAAASLHQVSTACKPAAAALHGAQQQYLALLLQIASRVGCDLVPGCIPPDIHQPLPADKVHAAAVRCDLVLCCCRREKALSLIANLKASAIGLYFMHRDCECLGSSCDQSAWHAGRQQPSLDPAAPLVCMQSLAAHEQLMSLQCLC